MNKHVRWPLGRGCRACSRRERPPQEEEPSSYFTGTPDRHRVPSAEETYYHLDVLAASRSGSSRSPRRADQLSTSDASIPRGGLGRVRATTCDLPLHAIRHRARTQRIDRRLREPLLPRGGRLAARSPSRTKGS